MHLLSHSETLRMCACAPQQQPYRHTHTNMQTCSRTAAAITVAAKFLRSLTIALSLMLLFKLLAANMCGVATSARLVFVVGWAVGTLPSTTTTGKSSTIIIVFVIVLAAVVTALHSVLRRQPAV